LLNHYGIKTKTVSYHEHNEREQAAKLIELLKTGSDVAVVSDAGTPGISDPGFRVVRLALSEQIPVVPVPGAVALIAALVASGLPSDEFFFGGFLPARSTGRRQRLAEVSTMNTTLVFYEAPHRIIGALRDARAVLGEREACVARELTKLHEEILRGRLSELALRLEEGNSEPRGEMVLIIDRHRIAGEENKSGPNVTTLVAGFEAEGLEPRAALKKAAKQLGLTRAEAYRRLTAERSREKDSY
jgi:16S rRNA (cytidine1402-2'-O)-methyltransferase